MGWVKDKFVRKNRRDKMGKKNRCRSAKGDQLADALPLDQQEELANVARPRGVPRVKKQTLKRDRKPDQYISDDLSAKILKTARAQKKSEEDEDAPSEPTFTTGRARYQSLGGISMGDASDIEDDEEVIEYDDEVIQLDPEVEKAMEMFLIKREDAPKARTLFDIIQDKIEQKKMEIETQMSQADNTQIREMDPQVEQMFRDIGVVLSRYRSGKIPKAFKVIPNMVNWEQILYLTNPDQWSAAAMYQATRLFASNLNPKMCQRFYNLVLLPRLRDDIDEYKKLNFHLYQALHKSLYKPAAFFKGILLPLIESGTCTLREATIFGSVLTKSSVPMLHAAAAMLKIAEMEYTGASSMFLRILIDKKYALPFRAIDALVFHFFNFRRDERELPVLWHQALLAFAQRYKSDISAEQRDALLELVKTHNHYQITPEVRRELQNATSRNEESEANIPDSYHEEGMEF
ncbi:hypothetical protein QR680_013251 [Steinernema hermaphroditum]|uniref:Bystin n=1 Tax=Steinernema hermaphroditum TaxID=289476 RepID=A0AA39I764_9BILA|nr:hypothetical protein QR680_013251 [Steinernema hermaphroditum]